MHIPLPMANATADDALTKKLKRMVSMPAQWILIQRTGSSATVDVDRYEIMRRFHVHARHLRVLDPLLSSPSTILARNGAIILNLEHIKTVITCDVVLLRDPTSDLLVPIVEELHRRLHLDASAHEPFELRALEVTLEGACSFLDARVTELEAEAYPALDELASKFSTRNMDRVHRFKCATARLATRVRRVRDELERIVEDDNEVADLCLTGCYAEEVEMLMEMHFSQVEDTLGKLTRLRKYMDATEEYVNMKIDNRRNRLIQAELLLNSGSMCLSVHTLLTGFFAMSIHNPWWGKRERLDVFKVVVVMTTVTCLALYAWIVATARRKGIVGSGFSV